MRSSHVTSTPFPSSHSPSTAIVISSGSSRSLFLMLAILFPRSSLRSKVPKMLIFGPTRSGNCIMSSCGRVGVILDTAMETNKSNLGKLQLFLGNVFALVISLPIRVYHYLKTINKHNSTYNTMGTISV